MLADDVLGAGRERPGEPLHPAYVAAFERITANPYDHLIVAEVDGAVVACAQLTLLSGLSHTGLTRAQIEGVRVASSHRGRGLGEALIRDLIARARADGAGLVQLTSTATRERARSFYEQLGFQATHIGFKLDLRTAAPAADAEASTGTA
jgi:ribosomal protein S18 acetylase RimI-like enzyme